MSSEGEPTSSWFVGRAETAHAMGAVTGDPIVIAEVYCVGLDVPSVFSMEPATARAFAIGLIEQAYQAELCHEEGTHDGG